MIRAKRHLVVICDTNTMYNAPKNVHEDGISFIDTEFLKNWITYMGEEAVFIPSKDYASFSTPRTTPKKTNTTTSNNKKLLLLLSLLKKERKRMTARDFQRRRKRRVKLQKNDEKKKATDQK